MRVLAAAITGAAIFAGTATVIEWANKREATTVERSRENGQTTDAKFGIEFFDGVWVNPFDDSRAD